MRAAAAGWPLAGADGAWMGEPDFRERPTAVCGGGGGAAVHAECAVAARAERGKAG